MKNLFALMLSIIVYTVIGQSNSTTVPGNSEIRSLSEFSEMSVSAGISVILDASNTNQAKITVQNADLDEVITEIEGDDLIIKWTKNNGWGNKRKATVVLKYTNLDGIDASSGSTVECEDKIQAEEFHLDASSGCSLDLDLSCTDISVDMSSGSYVKIKGSANNQRVDISSGAVYKAVDFKSKNTSVDASSGSVAKVYATNEFAADVSSGASVKYGGDPKSTDIDANKYSGGAVSKM